MLLGLMTKRICLVLIIFSIFFNLQADVISETILELQKKESILVDNIYDHKDYATEIWNEIINISTPRGTLVIDNQSLLKVEGLIQKTNKAITALNYAIESGDLLNELQDKLIEYYSVHNSNTYNLGIVKQNKQKSQSIIREVYILKQEFTKKLSILKDDITSLKKEIITLEQIHKEQIGLLKKAELKLFRWTSIPRITDEQFRREIYDYYTGGANKFIHKKPVVLIFYNASKETNINQLKNMESVYIKYSNKINFYRVSSYLNKELIYMFQVTELPTIYYLNLNSILEKHMGIKSSAVIEDKIINHLDVN